MPRFPIVAQRPRAPAVTSNSPEADELDQVMNQRHAVREAKRVRDAAEAERLAEETTETHPVVDIERGQQRFQEKAEGLRRAYKDHPLEGQVVQQIEVQRQAWTQKLISAEAGKRAKADLARSEEIAARWFERVEKEPARFEEAAARLLGDDGPLRGLGLRPEARAAWEARAFEDLLSAQMAGDPRRLVADLEAGRWKDRLTDEQEASWLEDARDAAALRARVQDSENRQRTAGEALALQQSIVRGEAGLAEIRRAEREGRFSPPQLAGLKEEAARAVVRAQVTQAAQADYALAMIDGADFDAARPQHRQAAEDFYIATFRAAVRSGADEATQERIADAVARTGHLTKGLAQDLTGALLSSDPERQVAAAQLYGRLLQTTPDLLPQALDLEARARGGVLSRWLDAGLPQEEALRRAEAELPRDDRAVPFLDEEETAGLQRDLQSLFLSEQPARHVKSILDQLERNYLGDLGRGLTPRQARQKLRRDAGRVIAKLTRARSMLESEPAWIEHSRKDTEAQGGLFHRTNAIPIQPISPPVYGTSQVDQDLNAAAAQELQGGAGDLSDEVSGFFYDLDEAIALERAKLFPAYAAWLFGHVALSIGDDEILLGRILEEDDHNHSRLVEIMHPDHGRMIVRQERDNPKEDYRDISISFVEPGTWEWVTERLLNSRFFTKADEGDGAASAESVGLQDSADQARGIPGGEHRPIIQPGPSSEPIPAPQLTPFPEGEGRERVPNHTGGDQMPDDRGRELTTESPVHEPGPQVHVTPDHSEELSQPLYALNEEGTPIYDGIPISERFIHKAGQKHKNIDVWYDEKGYPIFDKYVIETVEIELTGSRRRDRRNASKKALQKGKLTSIPKGFVWHHHQDMKTMQLLPDWVHRMVGHSGGAKNSEKDYK